MKYLVLLLAVSCGPFFVPQPKPDTTSMYEFSCTSVGANKLRCENSEVVCYVFSQSSNCKFKDQDPEERSEPNMSVDPKSPSNTPKNSEEEEGDEEYATT